MAQGILFVISAPSGTGKSSLACGLMEREPGLVFSVSYTTRPKRPGEEDGREYHFVDDAAFDGMVARGEFLEWAHVFERRYGTGRRATDAALTGGQDLLLDIDVQGARQIRASGISSIGIFVLPPNFATLADRLRGRASEADPQVRRRLAAARSEAEEYRIYDYLIVNDSLESAVTDLAAIVRAERRRTGRRIDVADRIVATFPAPQRA